MLKNPHKMFHIPGVEDHKEKLKLYEGAFVAFHKIVSGTFGCTLDAEWETHLSDFRRRYVELELPVTPKVKLRILI